MNNQVDIGQGRTGKLWGSVCRADISLELMVGQCKKSFRQQNHQQTLRKPSSVGNSTLQPTKPVDVKQKYDVNLVIQAR